jgi:hypothetical protein
MKMFEKNWLRFIVPYKNVKNKHKNGKTSAKNNNISEMNVGMGGCRDRVIRFNT